MGFRGKRERVEDNPQTMSDWVIEEIRKRNFLRLRFKNGEKGNARYVEKEVGYRAPPVGVKGGGQKKPAHE